MRAKKLFDATDDLNNARPYVAALVMLQAKAPVHYSVLLATEVIWTANIPTAGTDGVYVYINPQFFRGLESHSQRAFLLAHEVSHIILRHPQRGKVYQDRGFFSVGKAFDHSIYNRAADYVINADCIAMGFEKIEDGCYSNEYGRNDIVDSVYASLTANDDQDNQSSDDQSSDDQSGDDGEAENGAQGDDSGDPCGDSGSDDGAPSSASGDPLSGTGEPAGHDYHLTPEYESADDAVEDESELRNAVDDGIDEADVRGHSVSEEVKRGSKKHCPSDRSDVDWRAELADLMHRIGDGTESTWARIHRRRYSTLGVVSPSKRGSLGRIGIVVDVSPSVDDATRDRFITEVAGLIDELQPRDGAVIVWTGSVVVRADEVYSGGELLDLEIPYGGGTFMTKGLEWLTENGLECDIRLVFTDGDMYLRDWEGIAANDGVVVLDRVLTAYDARNCSDAGVRTIVAAA